MLSRVFVRNSSSNAASAKIYATLLLTRNPIITRDLPAFEKLYYKYQNELWKRLMWTFPKWFYYRPGTLGEQNFRELNKNPVYNNPNLEFTEGRPEIRHQRDRRMKQELRLPKTYKVDAEGNEIVDEDSEQDNLSRKIVPNSRVTEADVKKDLTSLERNLSRTLYLVTSTDSKTWELPTFENSGKDIAPLHQVAEDGLYKIGGDQINYYNVSPKPCHLISRDQRHEFLIKSHIVSGEFQPTDSSLKFMWLAKNELADYLDKDYYNEIKHLLNDI